MRGASWVAREYTARRSASQWAGALLPGGTGVEFALRLDPLSLVFALLALVIGSAVFIYSTAYLPPKGGTMSFYVLMTAFMLAVLLLVLADDVVLLFIGWELVSIASFLLIARSGSSGEAGSVRTLLLTFTGGLLLLAGRVGDLIGQRRIFLIGVTLFTAASLACAASQTQEMLIVARFIQGVGGAMASAVVLGMIVTMFPEPREQAKAIGVYGFVASAGGSIGLLAGGVLTDLINWHWIFFVNLPIGVAAFAAALRLLPRTERAGRGRTGFDLVGVVLLGTGVVPLVKS